MKRPKCWPKPICYCGDPRCILNKRPTTPQSGVTPEAKGTAR